MGRSTLSMKFPDPAGLAGGNHRYMSNSDSDWLLCFSKFGKDTKVFGIKTLIWNKDPDLE